MKRVLSFLLIIGLFFGVVACSKKTTDEEIGGDNKKSEIETSLNDKSNLNDKPNEVQGDLDEIELSINNFTEFFTYEKGLKKNSATAGQYWYAYTIHGVLDFAYYKDVVITFDVTYQVTSTQNKVKRTYIVHTNAAGDVSFFEKDAAKSLGISEYYKISFNVKSVSGMICLYK